MKIHAGCAAPPSYVPAGAARASGFLRRGIGNSVERVTTNSKDAQAYCDQGLNYLESYVWIEAARSAFIRRSVSTPNLAMAYATLSYGCIPDSERRRRRRSGS